MTQATNGKWYLYVVDDSIATLMDADDNGMEFGSSCTTGHGSGQSISTDLVTESASGYDVWVNGVESATVTVAGGCFDLDNAPGTDDGTDSGVRAVMTKAVLQGAPSLSDPDGDAANLGQRGHALNGSSNQGTWPYIISDDLGDDNIIEYGSDAISVTYGNTDDETGISMANRNPAGSTEIHLSITDPALNIDPTTADKWIFDLSDDNTATSVIFGNNGTNDAFTPAELGQMQCSENCQLTSDAEGVLAAGGGNGVDAVVMTESGPNTGVFESWER